MNLISGTLTANQIIGSLTPSLGYLNFNGGTLAKNNVDAADAFVSLLAAATIWPGGAIIQSDAGMDARINQSLVTPTGLGVGTITLSNVGSGYLDTPFVFFVDGGGSGGYSAVANVSNGQVTSITITNPGMGYTASPEVQLLGGGGGGIWPLLRGCRTTRCSAPAAV